MTTSTDQPITAEALVADFRATLTRERREARARKARRTARVIKTSVVAGALAGLAFTATVRTLTDEDLTPHGTEAPVSYVVPGCDQPTVAVHMPRCRR